MNKYKIVVKVFFVCLSSSVKKCMGLVNPEENILEY